MNMIDLMAICPFYISLILEGLEDFEIIGKTSKIIRLVGQVLRINILILWSGFWDELCGSTTFFVLISKMIRLVLIINDPVSVMILRCGLCGFWGSSSWFGTLLDSSLFSTLCSKHTRCYIGASNYFILIFLPGVGSPCLGCTRRHSHLLVSGHHLIKWLTHYTLTLSLFYLFQVYFAERENQISLGDLEAVNCTGWVEGANNEYLQFVIKTSSYRPF